MLCSICKENIAVIFITKIEGNNQTQEGICLSCAKKQGIEPLSKFIEQTGITDDDIDNLSKQVIDILDNDKIKDDNKFSFANLFNIINNSPAKDLDNDDLSSPTLDIDKDKSIKTKVQEKKAAKKKKYLDVYGINLTEKALNGKVDKIIGRTREIDRVVQILNRRTKNNPALIGEPGVGKTAIAEGLAVRIAEKQVPAKLFNYEVYLLDFTALVAGTQFRGQFEGRLKGLIDEVKALGNIILVIDELHNIVGAGDAEGAMSAANILKPPLARGEIQVIGITTLKEYKKYIEKDSALERRFQPIIIEEPSINDTIEMIKGIKNYYENYHKVKISEQVVNAAVILSERYITDRFLPDKAIDIIDEAGSRANLKNIGLVELEALKEELKKVQAEKELAASTDSIEDYQKAAELKVKECKLISKIADIEEESKNVEITIDDIAYVVESWTKIPVQRITEVENEKLIRLDENLKRRVIGQDEAVTSLSKAIRRNRAGFKKKKSPVSFIFVGPTGVGKTELVKVLADELFDTEDALVRLDMSEYMEKHTVAKIIGSPPGYVGFDEGGQLVGTVRRKPYCIILLDEIEKAHPDVFNIFLQVLEDGRLTDSHGRVVNFSNTVIIMTSNIGTSIKSNNIGFGDSKFEIELKIKEMLKETFRPEFLNRVDEIIVFKELQKDELLNIINLMVVELQDKMQEMSLKLQLSNEVKEEILCKGYNPKYGARPLRRAIQKLIEDELTDLILQGKYNVGDRVKIEMSDGKIIFE